MNKIIIVTIIIIVLFGIFYWWKQSVKGCAKIEKKTFEISDMDLDGYVVKKGFKYVYLCKINDK
jgi:hypothetical protein